MLKAMVAVLIEPMAALLISPPVCEVSASATTMSVGSHKCAAPVVLPLGVTVKENAWR